MGFSLKIFKLLSLSFLTFLLSGCPFKVQPNQILPNDRRPAGIFVAQGRLFGQNNFDVSGFVSLYSTSSFYTLVLDGLAMNGLTVAPASIRVVVAGPTGVIAEFTLKSTSGTRNYSFSTKETTFVEVYLMTTTRVKLAKAALI